jgi:hypothetical protein
MLTGLRDADGLRADRRSGVVEPGEPAAPLSGSVTAVTVYQVDLPPLVIQQLEPLSTQWSP